MPALQILYKHADALSHQSLVLNYKMDAARGINLSWNLEETHETLRWQSVLMVKNGLKRTKNADFIKSLGRDMTPFTNLIDTHVVQ